MSGISGNLDALNKELGANTTLIAVSKTHPAEAIQEAYNSGQKDFGENKVQEMISKYEVLPKDIRWHLIGHLQTNKVKYVAPFVNLIHSVDSLKLLQEINKQALKNNRVIDCLLQIHIATEETKFGLSIEEAESLLSSSEYKTLENIRIKGLMGMATNTDDTNLIRKEFRNLKQFFDQLNTHHFHTERSRSASLITLSMGMSSDYKIAIEEGSNMIRLGSSIFGTRSYA